MTLTSAGVLTSTTATPAGKYTFTVTASNGVGTAATQSFTLSVNQAPAITSAATTAFTSGTAGSFTFKATGFPAPTFTETGTLPTGVTLTSAGVLTSTTATPAGQYTFTVTASNGVGTAATQSFSLTVTGSGTIDHPAAAASYTAVNGTLFGANGPQYTDVQQGDVGDCWLMSSLAAVAARKPSDITSMFTSAGTAVENGTTVNLYQVRFYNTSGTAEYVTVDTELPAGGTYYDLATTGVLWVALAEKAYAQANGLGYVTTQYAGQDSYNALNGGESAWALQALTNQPQTVNTASPTDVATAWNNGQIICLGSSAAANDNLIVGDSTGTHAYAVVGYNASSSTPFELYNPWGASSTLNGLVSYNGGSVYGGTFWAASTLISSDFTSEFLSTGSILKNAHPSNSETTSLPLAVSIPTKQADLTNAGNDTKHADQDLSASNDVTGKSVLPVGNNGQVPPISILDEWLENEL